MSFLFSDKNLSLTPGVDSSVSVPLQTDTFLDLDPSQFNFKIEFITISHGDKPHLAFTSSTGFSGSAGVISKIFSKTDLVGLDEGLYKYRILAINSTTLDTGIIAKGFVNINKPEFSYDATAYQPTIALEDGTLYANGPVDLTLGAWYVASKTLVFNIYGNAGLSIELKMSNGTFIQPFATFVTPNSDMSTWIISKDGVFSFKVTQIGGSLGAKIKYLPT